MQCKHQDPSQHRQFQAESRPNDGQMMDGFKVPSDALRFAFALVKV